MNAPSLAAGLARPAGNVSAANRYRAMIYMVIACAAYIVSAPLTAQGYQLSGHLTCHASQFQVFCRYPQDSSFDVATYLCIGSLAAIAMAITAAFHKSSPYYPLVMFFGNVALFAILYDVLAHEPVQSSSKLTNDTFNTLRFAITASFALVFYIARHARIPAWSAVLAIGLSYVAVYLIGLLFFYISAKIMGATEIYLLFMLYAFGGFSIHIMTIAQMFTHIRSA